MSQHVQVIRHWGKIHYETKKQALAGVKQGRLKMLSAFVAIEMDRRPSSNGRIEKAPKTYPVSKGYAIRWQQQESRYRRERRLSLAAGWHTVEQWRARIEFYGWLCKYCGVALNPKNVTKDHQIPIARGGSEWPSNLVPSCRSCNCWKGMRKIRVLGT